MSTSLVLLPLYTWATGNAFLLTLFTRIVILAIAATSSESDSWATAAWSASDTPRIIGVGGYAVGMLANEGITSGFVQWPVALAVSALFALFVGALSLRTRGVYFIMITLAFAQMVYYVAVGLDRYGGDDGLTIYSRSQFAGLINLGNRTVFYYVCVMLLFAVIYGTWRVVNSRFGLVIQGSRSNDRRMRAIGFPTFRYRLVCFVIAGMICGLAGALLANHADVRQPRHDALDALRRPDRHGRPRRHGIPVRSTDRCGRPPRSGGSACPKSLVPSDISSPAGQ